MVYLTIFHYFPRLLFYHQRNKRSVTLDEQNIPEGIRPKAALLTTKMLKRMNETLDV